MTFDVTLDLDVKGSWKWTEDHKKELDKEYDRIGNDEMFSFWGYEEADEDISDIIEEATEAANSNDEGDEDE